MTIQTPFALPANAIERASQVLAVQDSNPTINRLGASGMSLVPSGGGITDDQANACYMLQLYGQGTALGQLQQKGVNIKDPKVFQSYDYYSYYIDNLSSLGLNVQSASDEKVNQKSYSGSIKVGDILLDVLSAFIPEADLANMTKLFQLLSATSDTKITDFLNFFWDNASYNDSQSSMAFGPLINGNEGMPEFTVVYYNFNYSMTHWRSLFVEIENASLDVYSSAIRLSYDMDLYNSTVRPSIMPIIKNSIKSHVASTPFTMG